MDLTTLTIIEAADLIKRKQISPYELTAAHLDRIEQIDPQINSFLLVMGEQALSAARRAEQEILRGEFSGPLHGIPLALKDLYDTVNIRTTAGSLFFEKNIPTEDGFVVRKLHKAGAIILGKLNMHEIALGVTNVNPHFGPCRNPWMLDHISGGSSGGSAAALAAELCLGSLGSDTGGSIRIPSSLCGVVGLKPTFGRVSLRGVIPLSWNLDHAGPIARRVADVAIILQTIAGYDAEYPFSIDTPADDYVAHLGRGVKNLRIAFAVDEFFSRVDPQVFAAVQEAGRVFRALGADVEEVQFPKARQAARVNGLMTTSDAAAFHRERLQTTPEGFGEDVLERLRAGASLTSTEYVLARQTQTILRRKFEQFFNKFDLLITATTPIIAPPIEGPDAIEQAMLLTRFTAPFNLTGLPALSLPCGLSDEGLPIGLQIVAGPWKEALVLQAGYAYEEATKWHTRRPIL